MAADLPSKEATELSAFQRAILTVLAEEPQYGLKIKASLEAYYRAEVNHGRLYPNLNTLFDGGYINNEPLDKRTNQYSLTEEGKNLLQELIDWEQANLD